MSTVASLFRPKPRRESNRNPGQRGGLNRGRFTTIFWSEVNDALAY